MGSTIAPSDCSGTFKISSLEEFAWWSCCYWLCTNVSYVQMFHMSKLSFPVYMLMARVSQVQAALPEPSSSTFQSALLRVEFGYLASFNYICILLFCILNMCLLIHQNPCVAWFDCCSLVCLSALTLELRQLSERAETLGASFRFRVGTFINIYQGITFVNICLTLFDQTSNESWDNWS